MKHDGKIKENTRERNKGNNEVSENWWRKCCKETKEPQKIWRTDMVYQKI